MDAATLARRYEPVLRFTDGEMFFPMAVDAYVAQSALWVKSQPGDGQNRGDRIAFPLVEHGRLDLDRLCRESRQRPGENLELRYVEAGLGWRELRDWRREPDRPRFRPSPRLAAVGLPGRVIDLFFRLSLIFRGRVPRGLTAATQRAYQEARATAGNDCPYYVRVTTDGGYTVVQYWFFYAMNDWRTSFAGVNDHGGDWEQVTLYLAPDVDEVLRPAWVAFSSHELTGGDVRRRHDDPDLEWVDGTHPVAYVGAGSHSGAPLRGEYLVQLELPFLQRLAGISGSIRETLMPWTRGRPHPGLGIPYVDYKRGDGRQLGPGGDSNWTAVPVDEDTGWIHDFRGLWGLDTDDPFGGERAPAGPRYERDGSIRPSWADPVGWAALDSVPATPAEQLAARSNRLADIECRSREIDAEIELAQAQARSLAAGSRALALSGVRSRRRAGTTSGDTVAATGAAAAAVAELRASRRALTIEREALDRQPAPADEPVHAHLRHRQTPLADHVLDRSVLVRFWAGASLSILLALFGLALILDLDALPRLLIGGVLVVMTLEAAIRRRLVAFLLGLLMVAVAVAVLWLLVDNWRIGLGFLALVVAGAVALANVRVLLARR